MFSGGNGGKQRSKRGRETDSVVFEEEPVDQQTLYMLVLKNQIPVADLASGWITRYQEDRDTALLELIQFFINSSGCRVSFQ